MSVGVTNFISSNLTLAGGIASDFGLDDLALRFFGRAAHTLADAGSPFHVAEDGTPKTWYGTFGQGGLTHIVGEFFDYNDWAHIGTSIRGVIAGFYKAFPEQAPQLLGNQDAAAQRAIENRTM